MFAHSSPAQRLQTYSLKWDADLVWLYLGPGATSQRGQVVAKILPAPKCEDLQALEDAVGRAFPRACTVLNSFVADDLLGQGYGVQLYTDAARAAARRHDAPLISAACHGSDISDEARRLWGSERLADRVVVRGLTAWGGNP